MNYVLDLHTHTIASGHAYSSMREMAQAAADKDLAMLGLTEHAPAMPGTCHPFYFQNLKVIPRTMYGVQLLMGAELNIVDYEGHVDMEGRDLESLDVTVASLHSPCFKAGSVVENTRAYVNAMKNPYINIIGHPDDARMPADYKALVEAAKEYHKVIELNNSSLRPFSFRENAKENDVEILRWCMEYEVPIVVDSDAHIDVDVGNFDYAIPLLEMMKFPEHLILNRNTEAIKPYLNFYR
ncbi:MAG: phosphatase [Lachnospiraceae bacterium]